MAWIRGIVTEPEPGTVYMGKVKSIMPYGAFVEFMPGKEGLLHVSELEWAKVDKVEDYHKEGQQLEVKLLDIDKKTGKFRLSKRALTPKPEGYVEPERSERPPRSNDRGGDRGGYRGDRGGDRGDRRPRERD
mgnify:CR=1 FL=1